MNDSKQESAPVWRDADVIRLTDLEAWNPYATLIRKDGVWRGVHNSTTEDLVVARCWNDGAVQILYKVDPRG